MKDLWLILFEYYPAHRRGDPDSGFPEFAKLKPNQAMLDRMIAAIGKLKESDSWTEKGGKFVPGLVKWLAAKGWESVPIKVEACKTCNRTGAILRNGDKVLPWSLEGEGELTPEICPDCKGKNRISVAGFPQKLELELIRKK